MQQKTNTKYIRTTIIAAVLLVVFLIIYMVTRPRTAEGVKEVTIEVVHGDGSSKQETFQTDLDYLGELLKTEQIAEGEDGPYGLYIQTVDGERADESAQEWWCITKDGEMHMLSADETVLEDGDKYELTLETGYDE